MREAAVPLVTLSWTGAFVGEVGRCVSETPVRIRISGRVVRPDGSAATGAWVGGCSSESKSVDREGAFSVETWRGEPCTLRTHSPGIHGVGAEVRRTEDVSEIVLIHEEHSHSDALEADADEVDRLSRSANPIEIALEDPDLSDDVRAQLEEWRTRDAERSEHALQKRELTAEFLRELETR
jgi:hypothetical protein